MATPTNKLVSCDRLWLIGLLAASLTLYSYNLDSLPLRDWDEGTVAMVAREIWRSPEGIYSWLFPQLEQHPYWNKPPLIHWLIAISYSWFGISEWSTRLLPTTISALSVPLLYGIGREIFPQRLEAIFSALVYLTLLPVVRHGRLAMLDGAIACWFCLTIWCLLRGRKQPRFYWGVGLGLSLICLTKGIMLGILLGIIALLFVAWEQFWLLKSGFFWLAVGLGIIPALAWYLLQYWHYGAAFIDHNLGNQSIERIWTSVENHRQPLWYYLLEIAKYTLPWLIFLPGGIKLALNNSRTTWAKLSLVWGGIYLLAISVMTTKLPWYVIPLYPGVSLLIGANIASSWRFLSQNSVFRGKIIIFCVLAIITCSVAIFYFLSESKSDRLLGVVFIALTVTFLIVAVMLGLRSPYSLVVLVVGWYAALLLFFHSSHWIWELAEDYSVRPVAAMVRQHTKSGSVIYIESEIYRPSLAFYSDRRIVAASKSEIEEHWQVKSTIYALLPQPSDLFSLNDLAVLDSTPQWLLVTKNKDFRQIDIK